jgi:hypothetical protein
MDRDRFSRPEQIRRHSLGRAAPLCVSRRFWARWSGFAQDLDIANRIDAEPLGDALPNDLDQPRHRSLGVVSGHEVEIRLGARLRQFWRLPGINPVRVLDDLALGGLSEHFGQADDRDGARTLPLVLRT